MPWYRKGGKKMVPLQDEEWLEAMSDGYFVDRKHIGFMAVLYYTAVRKSEVLRSLRQQFNITGSHVFFDVGIRLKHGKLTPPLPLPLEAEYVDEIAWAVKETDPGDRVWPYCPRTAWNIVNRVLPGYPHFFRLSRITNFFLEGWTIAQVKAWTGLSLQALNFYVGLADIQKMGDSFVRRPST